MEKSAEYIKHFAINIFIFIIINRYTIYIYIYIYIYIFICIYGDAFIDYLIEIIIYI